jgi:NADPH-dependent 2,4-dienoyl-CoA reductase/sulfur reductase-like enzyme
VSGVQTSASGHDPLYLRRRRIEHWSNANYQGTEAGKVLAGQGGGYGTVSSFFTEVFGLTVRVFGDVSRFDELTTTDHWLRVPSSPNTATRGVWSARSPSARATRSRAA